MLMSTVNDSDSHMAQRVSYNVLRHNYSLKVVRLPVSPGLLSSDQHILLLGFPQKPQTLLHYITLHYITFI